MLVTGSATRRPDHMGTASCSAGSRRAVPANGNPAQQVARRAAGGED